MHTARPDCSDWTELAKGPHAGGSLSSVMFSLQRIAVSLGNLTTCPNSPCWTAVAVCSEAAHCGWRSLWLQVWPQGSPCPACVEYLSRVGARLENCPWLNGEALGFQVQQRSLKIPCSFHWNSHSYFLLSTPVPMPNSRGKATAAVKHCFEPKFISHMN